MSKVRRYIAASWTAVVHTPATLVGACPTATDENKTLKRPSSALIHLSPDELSPHRSALAHHVAAKTISVGIMIIAASHGVRASPRIGTTLA